MPRGRACGLPTGRGLAEDLLAEERCFPLITCLEVIEHVPDPAGFVKVLTALLEPDGMLVLSTLNRTRRSWMTAKFGAEYVLRILPTGTHDWRAFITPAELAGLLRTAGLRVEATTGLRADPLTGRWRTGRGHVGELPDRSAPIATRRQHVMGEQDANPPQGQPSHTDVCH